MKKRVLRYRIFLFVMLMVLPFVMISIKGSAVATKKVVSNYIDYTKSKKSNVIKLKMHKATKKKVAWSSTNQKVAVVKSTGKSSAKVIIKGKGTCTIKAKVSGVTYTAKITAAGKKGGSKKILTMNMIPTREVRAGEVFTLKAALQPSSLSSKDIKWKSSDPSIATVSDKGQVSLLKQGTVTITAYYSKNTKLSVSTTFNVAEAKILISQITLSGPKKGYVGSTVTFNANILPQNASNKTLSWVSSDANIASVDQNGVVTCKAVGTVTISIYTTDGTDLMMTSEPLTIEVPRATELDIETSRMPQPLQVGDSFTLTATVKPENARNKNVVWYSDDEDVLTIDENGLVNCTGAGTATITVESADAEAVNLKKELEITVYEKKNYIRSMKITGPDLAVADMDISYQVSSLLPTDYEDKITWTSSNPSVATIKEGTNAGSTVHTIKEGKTTITATTTTGLKTQIYLEVVKTAYPKNMAIDKIPTVKLYADSQFTMVATLTNVKGEEVASPLIWTSSDPSVATVDANGHVTALKAGTTTITVTSEENKQLTHSETFTFCEGVAVKKLTIGKDNIPEGVIFTGDEFDLIAVITPTNATDKDVTWVSSNEEVATVDANGHFKALKTGTVDITVYLNVNKGIKAKITIPVDGYRAQE